MEFILIMWLTTKNNGNFVILQQFGNLAIKVLEKIKTIVIWDTQGGGNVLSKLVSCGYNVVIDEK